MLLGFHIHKPQKGFRYVLLLVPLVTMALSLPIIPLCPETHTHVTNEFCSNDGVSLAHFHLEGRRIWNFLSKFYKVMVASDSSIPSFFAFAYPLDPFLLQLWSIFFVDMILLINVTSFTMLQFDIYILNFPRYIFRKIFFTYI